jgi:hypothetical protein
MGMATHKIQNWTRTHALDVGASGNHGDIPPLVCVDCMYGPLRLYHAMTPEQAREMASVLLASAEEAELSAAKEAA